jgi:hypothetical protein
MKKINEKKRKKNDICDLVLEVTITDERKELRYQKK